MEKRKNIMELMSIKRVLCVRKKNVLVKKQKELKMNWSCLKEKRRSKGKKINLKNMKKKKREI